MICTSDLTRCSTWSRSFFSDSSLGKGPACCQFWPCSLPPADGQIHSHYKFHFKKIEWNDVLLRDTSITLSSRDSETFLPLTRAAFRIIFLASSCLPWVRSHRADSGRILKTERTYIFGVYLYSKRFPVEADNNQTIDLSSCGIRSLFKGFTGVSGSSNVETDLPQNLDYRVTRYHWLLVYGFIICRIHALLAKRPAIQSQSIFLGMFEM